MSGFCSGPGNGGASHAKAQLPVCSVNIREASPSSCQPSALTDKKDKTNHDQKSYYHKCSRILKQGTRVQYPQCLSHKMEEKKDKRSMKNANMNWLHYQQVNAAEIANQEKRPSVHISQPTMWFPMQGSSKKQYPGNKMLNSFSVFTLYSSGSVCLFTLKAGNGSIIYHQNS